MNQLTRWTVALMAAGTMSLALAQALPDPGAKNAASGIKLDTKAPVPGSPEAQVATLFQERSGSKADMVSKTPYGLYEIVTNGEILYVDEKVNYVIAGKVFDSRTREDLTEKRKEEVLRVDFKTLPLDRAVKIVKGDGSRVLVTFEDPNCAYCKRLWQNMHDMKNVTVYTFLFPILSADSYEKSKTVWCSKDRSKVWDNFMGDGGKLTAADKPAAECKTPLDENLALGKQLGITGTPTLIFADGRRAPGALPLAQIEQRMSQIAANK